MIPRHPLTQDAEQKGSSMKLKFLSEDHRDRFLSLFKRLRTNPLRSEPEYCAAIYLLTADPDLWETVSDADGKPVVNIFINDGSGVSAVGEAFDIRVTADDPDGISSIKVTINGEEKELDEEISLIIIIIANIRKRKQNTAI